MRYRNHMAALQASLSSLPTPAGDLLVTAGGAKRPKLIVLASEIGKTVTGSTKLAIAVRWTGWCCGTVGHACSVGCQ